MLQYLEMSAVLPAGFSQLWSMGISIPLPRRLVLRALEAGECLSAFKKTEDQKGNEIMAALTISKEEEKRLKGLGFLNNKGTDNFSARVITVNGKVNTAQMTCLTEAA